MVTYGESRLPPSGSIAGWISYPAISPVPSPPPVRLRAEPLSHRLPLQGGVLEASTRLPVELYYSPLEGESQKPSRMATADAVGGNRRALKRRLMRWGATPRLPDATAEKTLDAYFGRLLRFGYWSQGARIRANREAGAIPARSRHCDQRARRRSRPLLLQAMGRQPAGRLSCQSGDLPWD